MLQFSDLEANKAARALVLRTFEKLMKSEEKERDWCFLDRNYVEKLDEVSIRQRLADLFVLRPDVKTQYYEREDALLLVLYFKNPPGRLCRRQWTGKLKTLPSFSIWKKFFKDAPENLPSESLALDNQREGFLRLNTKFAYPSDDSMIRVDKCLVGSRRIGSSMVLKDNFIMGVRERVELFNANAGEEEEFLSREAYLDKDRRCEMWMTFENGLKLLVEM